jgi:DNA-binding response OmpR family regulator
MKILVVDTDRESVEMLTNWLKTAGYEIYRAYTGERAKIVWEEQQPDLVILDTNLKDVDTLKMYRDLRGEHDTLVVVTTDDQGPQREVTWLEFGADDYLRKPYSSDQLLAHIHAVVRRKRLLRAQRPSSIITVGPIRVDVLRSEVNVDGKTSRLTPVESRLLQLLAVNANNVCTISLMVSYVWGFSHDGDTGLLKTYIRHIRQKVEPDPSNPTYILTIPGVGYTLVSHDLDEAVQKTST